MRKVGLLFVGVIFLLGVISFVSAAQDFTNTINIRDGQIMGFNPEIGDTSSDFVQIEQYDVVAESVFPNNISFRLEKYDLSTSPATKYSSDITYSLQIGGVVAIDEPNINIKSVKLLNIKYEEFPCGNEGGETVFCQEYIARMVFSTGELSPEKAPSRLTTCEERTCTLSIKDVLIMAALDGEEYSFNIESTHMEENIVEIDINEKNFELLGGEFVDLRQFGFPIEISIKEISEKYIIFETKELFDSYRVTTPENFLQKILNWFKGIFAGG